jgi:hypothetical protein
MKYVIVICMVLVVFAAGSQKEVMDGFEKSFSQFTSHFAAGRYFDAHAELHHSLELFWENTPLLLRNARFVKGDDNSYGIFEPKDGDIFAAGEPVYLYLEPIGYAFKKKTEGYYAFGFKADFTLEDDKGNELGGQKGFADLNFNSWNHNTEVSVTFTYTFTGFDEGKYKVITYVMDAYSGKSATVEKWFNIR